MLLRIFGSNMDKVTEGWRKIMMFVICMIHHILMYGQVKEDEMGWVGHKGLRSENPEGRYHLDDVGIDGRIIYNGS
jgi:hypothetical protein